MVTTDDNGADNGAGTDDNLSNKGLIGGGYNDGAKNTYESGVGSGDSVDSFKEGMAIVSMAVDGKLHGHSVGTDDETDDCGVV